MEELLFALVAAVCLIISSSFFYSIGKHDGERKVKYEWIKKDLKDIEKNLEDIEKDIKKARDILSK